MEIKREWCLNAAKREGDQEVGAGGHDLRDSERSMPYPVQSGGRTMTRQEHIDWCKKRAHEYLDRGDITNAIASMMSDLNKHEETRQSAGGILSMLGMQAVVSGDSQAAKRFIDGFN